MYSIKLNVTEANGGCDKRASKFFGNPLLPKQWIEDRIFGKTELFLCQIKLSDIAELDEECILPHTGFLYFFLDVKSFPYTPIVRYTGRVASEVYHFFNENKKCDYDVTKEYLISFKKGLESNIYYNDEFFEDGIKLLGTNEMLDEDLLLENYTTLLEYDTSNEREFTFLHGIDAKLFFIIKREQLKAKDFSGVKLYIHRP